MDPTPDEDFGPDLGGSGQGPGNVCLVQSLGQVPLANQEELLDSEPVGCFHQTRVDGVDVHCLVVEEPDQTLNGVLIKLVKDEAGLELAFYKLALSP